MTSFEVSLAVQFLFHGKKIESFCLVGGVEVIKVTESFVLLQSRQIMGFF